MNIYLTVSTVDKIKSLLSVIFFSSLYAIKTQLPYWGLWDEIPLFWGISCLSMWGSFLALAVWFS